MSRCSGSQRQAPAPSSGLACAPWANLSLASKYGPTNLGWFWFRPISTVSDFRKVHVCKAGPGTLRQCRDEAFWAKDRPFCKDRPFYIERDGVGEPSMSTRPMLPCAMPDASSGVFERRKCLLRKTDFTSRFNLICPFNPSSENIWLAPSGKSVAFLRAFRTHKRGASRSSRVSGAECDGRGRRQLTSDAARGWRNRVVLIPRRWDQAL